MQLYHTYVVKRLVLKEQFWMTVLVTKVCSLLYIDSYYYKLKVRGCSFPNIIEKSFLSFNNPPPPHPYGHKAR